VVHAYPIDSLNLPVDGNRPVVMKVDVEGHEFEALSGAMEFLEKANIVYLAIELRPLRGKACGDIFKVLSARGLTPFRIDDYGDEVKLDPTDLRMWQHKKHPMVRYNDVVWRIEH
jgi:Methyltransferase FkbM domain